MREILQELLLKLSNEEQGVNPEEGVAEGEHDHNGVYVASCLYRQCGEGDFIMTLTSLMSAGGEQ